MIHFRSRNTARSGLGAGGKSGSRLETAKTVPPCPVLEIGKPIKIPQRPYHQHGATCEKTEAFKSEGSGASLAVQWLRIRLPMQGTRVRSLVREDPTCCRATKPVRHNY